MKKSGCIRLNLAIESGNENVLKLSLEKITEIVRYSNEEKIQTIGFILIGYPGGTKESFKETLTFFRNLLKLGLNGIAPFIVNPYPVTYTKLQSIRNKI